MLCIFDLMSRYYCVLKQIDCKFTGSYFTLEQLPRDPRPQIAFAGRSNVGKSSLLNKLAGKKKLAKVSSTPGKTRSINFFSVNDRFYFADLPGYGYAKVSKTEKAHWRKLIEGYLHDNDSLLGLMLLLDCRREPNEDDLQLIDWMHENDIPGIVVVTKIDKLNRDKIKRKTQEIQNKHGLYSIPFSIVTGVGKNEVLSAIFDLVNEKP